VIIAIENWRASLTRRVPFWEEIRGGRSAGRIGLTEVALNGVQLGRHQAAGAIQTILIDSIRLRSASEAGAKPVVDDEKDGFCRLLPFWYLAVVSPVQEIEAAIPKLSRAELKSFTQGSRIMWKITLN